MLTVCGISVNLGYGKKDVAHLLSAAPNLYEDLVALKAWIDATTPDSLPSGLLERINESIAKAEGKAFVAGKALA